MVYASDEVKLARTVVRVPEAEKWSKDLLAAVRLTPMSLHQPRAPEVGFKDKVDTESGVHETQRFRRPWIDERLSKM